MIKKTRYKRTAEYHTFINAKNAKLPGLRFSISFLQMKNELGTKINKKIKLAWK